jgi:hypothetical protein
MPRKVILNEYDSENEEDIHKLNSDNRDSHIYLNLSVFNNNTGFDKLGNPVSTQQGIQCELVQNQSIPYLENPQDYDLSVAQFNLDSNSFPIQIAQPIFGSSYQTILSSTNFSVEGFPTIFSITVTRNGVALPVTVPVYWVSSDLRLARPPSPITKPNLYTEYFWNYAYDYFIDLLNKSLYYAVDTLYPNLGVMPYFKYENGFFTFNAPPKHFRTDPITGAYVISSAVNFKVELNEPLYNLLAGLPAIFTTNNTYQLLSYPLGNTSNVFSQYSSLTVGAPVTTIYFRMTQDYKSALLWNPVTSVVFVTKTIPVVNELWSQPYVYGIDPVPETNNAAFLNTLFEISLGRRADPQINYRPEAQYFLTSLLGRQDLYEIQIQTFWRDDVGQLHEFFVEAGSSFNIKIMFRKKLFTT